MAKRKVPGPTPKTFTITKNNALKKHIVALGPLGGREVVCIVRLPACRSVNSTVKMVRSDWEELNEQASLGRKAEADQENRAVLADSHRCELEDAKQTAFINGKALWLSRFELRRSRSIGRAWMTACLITWLALAVTLLV